MIDREEEFEDKFNEVWEDKTPDFNKSLNVAVIGRVSAGKSSLLNALLRRKRHNKIADVGATSGVTTSVQAFKLDDNITIVDCPGLSDIKKENSRVTENFLSHIDVGILVVSGSADADQKEYLDDLKKCAQRTFVALNKWDEYDRMSQTGRTKVLKQWQAVLGTHEIYPTVAFGYDPDIDPSQDLDIRGVDELRNALEEYLSTEGKDLLLARAMGEKQSYALKIIITALTAVAVEAFIPGSAIYISATQVAAIASLHYLYTGKALSKSAAVAILPVFAAESVGTTLFLWAKSLLPPTGVVDAAAATVAVAITASMLAVINKVLASGHELHEKEILRRQYRNTKSQLTKSIRGSNPNDWARESFWKDLLKNFMF